LDGNVAQHIEYVPFGEVFIEERNSTWNTPYKFNAKELDEETGLYYYGARYYDPRVSIWYGADPMQEKYPGISTYCYTSNNPVKFVDLIGEEPTVKEAAYMSKHVYDDKGKLIGGWKVSDRKLKLEVKYKDDKIGFKSNLYERTNKDGSVEYAYVTAGTEITSEKDWENYINQLSGTSEQYKQSVINAKAITEGLGDAELTFTGHSLGGGLAAANALATGKNATTFNAAALSSATKKTLGLNNTKGYIFNVVVSGEILNFSQSLAGMKLEGATYMLNASYSLLPKIRAIQRVNNHSIGTVIKKLDKE
jgi:RHS repeat-associated protein